MAVAETRNQGAIDLGWGASCPGHGQSCSAGTVLPGAGAWEGIHPHSLSSTTTINTAPNNQVLFV